MFYKPKKEKLWDTWIIKHQDTYYMYYIRVSEFGTRWDGISLATSKDLIHWSEYGTVLKKDEDAIWLGTGMIQKIGSKFIMNYSMEKPINEQKIFFAESHDLIHWDKIENLVCEPDDINYLKSIDQIADSYPRWDSLGIVDALEDKKPPYYAFCTASTPNFKYPQKNAVIGFLSSDDGLHWKQEKPASNNLEIFSAFEVPEYVQINGRHYVIFCASSKLGFRYDKRANFLSGGSYYVTSDKFEGPYDLPNADPMLTGSRDNDNVTMNSVGRTIKENGEYLFYHIWGDAVADAWVGLVKILTEKSPGVLELIYWPKNESLKGQCYKPIFTSKLLSYSKKIGNQFPVEWKIDDHAIRFNNRGSSGYIEYDYQNVFSQNTELSDGRIFEYDLHQELGTGSGLFFEDSALNQICVFMNKEKGRLEFTYIKPGFGSNKVLLPIMVREHDVLKQEKLHVKLFIRKMFIEVYVNDVHISGLRIAETFNMNTFGYYSECSTGFIDNFNIWQMK